MTTNSDPRYVAEDGTAIEDGKRMWNYYDGVWVTIRIKGTSADPEDEFHGSWDGWFKTKTDSGGTIILNGQRLAGHPIMK